MNTHLVNKIVLDQVLPLALVGAFDGDEEDVDPGLPGEPRRLLHLVCGPTVHQHHGNVGRSSPVSVRVTEVLLVDVGESPSCRDTRGRQEPSLTTSIHSEDWDLKDTTVLDKNNKTLVLGLCCRWSEQ